jgi:T-complex protein 1 subunit eta
MDKLVYDSRGTTISNDGATIMKVRRRGVTRTPPPPRLGLAARALAACARRRAERALPPGLAQLLEIVHPAAKTLVDIAKSQDSEVRAAVFRRRGCRRPPPSAAVDSRAPLLSLPRARAQVGDGTTTVVLLAGEFLREAKQFVEDGVHPQLIIRAYRTAATLAVETVRKMSIRHAHPATREGDAHAQGSAMRHCASLYTRRARARSVRQP